MRAETTPDLLVHDSRPGPLPIEHVRVRIFEVSADSPVPMSFSSLSARRSCLVEVHSNGLVGIGESWVNYPSWAWRERLATLREGILPLLTGIDATDTAAVHSRLVSALMPLARQWGAHGPVWQAVSGVDLALWDLVGKAAGHPVAALLSSNPRTEVPVYASGIGPDNVEELVGRALAAGFEALKIKVGFGPDRDSATIQDVRRVAGDIRVFADANQAWTLEEGIRACSELLDYGVEWCEEPIQGNRPADLETLHERTGMPLATGENVYGLASFARYVGSPAVAHIQPDVSKTGGLTGALAVVDMAADNATSVSPHCYTGAVTLAGTAQLAAARQQVKWVELDIRENALRTDIINEPFVMSDGRLKVPDSPGLGITLDEARLQQYDITP